MARDKGPHLAPVLRASRFATVWWCTVLAGGLTLALLLVPAFVTTVVGGGPPLWVMLGFVVLGELRPVVIDRTDPDGVNLATTFLFAALLYWGPSAALLAIVVATIAGEVARRKRVYAALFNVAQYSLCYLAAGAVLLAGGWSATPDDPAQLAPGSLWLVVLAAATYHVVNLAIVSAAIALSDDRTWWSELTYRIGWYTLTVAAVTALSPLVVIVLDTHYAFLPLLALPLALLWKTAELALEREQHATTDPLTGLSNRAALAPLVEQQLREERVADRRTALCLVDLDRFKEVNDTLGHAVGDELLQAVADRMVANVESTEEVLRLGGDEFVLLLDVTDRPVEERLVEIAEHVHAPVELQGVRLEVEMSVGVAELGRDGDDAGTLLRRADAAMYEAKRAGELVRGFDLDLDRRTPARLQLLAELKTALVTDQLVVHYQPQVAVADGRVIGLEALVRWQHPTRGLLLPGAFLPLAEQTALTRQLTSTVLDLVVRQLAEWRATGIDVTVSVNASLHDLADDAFVDRVVARLADRGLDPAQLRLEITEQALAGDHSRVVQSLHALRSAGVRLSLDDFGTGHASLTRLGRLPVSEVKLDRQFVVELGGGSTQNLAVVRAVVELSRALGATTVAEGVETATQLAVLAGLGCDAVQGWLIAAALPPGEVATWLTEIWMPEGSPLTEVVRTSTTASIDGPGRGMDAAHTAPMAPVGPPTRILPGT